MVAEKRKKKSERDAIKNLKQIFIIKTLTLDNSLGIGSNMECMNVERMNIEIMGEDGEDE